MSQKKFLEIALDSFSQHITQIAAGSLETIGIVMRNTKFFNNT